MRKYLLISAILFLCYFGANSQSFQIVNDANEDISGTTIIVATVLDGTVEPHFKVKNVSGSEVSTRISKSYMDGPLEGSFDSMCSPTTIQSPNGTCVTGTQTPVFILNPGEVSGEVHIVYEQGTNHGVTTIQYKVFNTANTSDYKVINFSYSSVTAISPSQVRGFNVFPNPAVNEFIIEHNFGKKAVIEVFDVLGKSVLKLNSDSANRFTVDCSKWDNGYYFCRLYNEGKIEKTIKLVVTH